MSEDVSCTSPDSKEMLSRISWRKPDEIATAIIITRKLTAEATDAILFLNLILRAIKSDTSICRLKATR